MTDLPPPEDRLVALPGDPEPIREAPMHPALEAAEAKQVAARIAIQLGQVMQEIGYMKRLLCVLIGRLGGSVQVAEDELGATDGRIRVQECPGGVMFTVVAEAPADVPGG